MADRLAIFVVAFLLCTGSGELVDSSSLLSPTTADTIPLIDNTNEMLAAINTTAFTAVSYNIHGGALIHLQDDDPDVNCKRRTYAFTHMVLPLSTTATSEITLFVSIYVSNNTTALPGELIYTTNYSALLSLSATAEYVGVPFEFGASTDNRVLSASCCYLVTLSSSLPVRWHVVETSDRASTSQSRASGPNLGKVLASVAIDSSVPMQIAREPKTNGILINGVKLCLGNPSSTTLASSTLQADPDNTTKVLPDGSISVGKTAHDEKLVEIPILDEIHTGLRRDSPTISWTSSSTSTWIPSFTRSSIPSYTKSSTPSYTSSWTRSYTSSSTRSQFPHYPQTSPDTDTLAFKASGFQDSNSLFENVRSGYLPRISAVQFEGLLAQVGSLRSVVPTFSKYDSPCFTSAAHLRHCVC